MMYTNYFIDSLINSKADLPVLFETGKSITAGQLLSSAYHLAEGLKQDGVKKGDRTVIIVKPGIEFLQVIYANMMLGTIVSIIDPEMGRENYQSKLKQFAPDHAFVDSKLVLLNEHPILKSIVLKMNTAVPAFPRIRNCSLYTSGIWLPLLQKHKRIDSFIHSTTPNYTFEQINDKEDFLITYTSGTLSEPKGVIHSYYSLSNSIKLLTQLLKKHQDETIATHLPHYALLGINAGMKVHLWDNKMGAREKIEFLKNYKITTLFGPPSDFAPLIEYLNYNKTAFPEVVKNIYLGSAPIYTSFLAQLIPVAPYVKVSCLYGMTENLMVSIQDGVEKLHSKSEGDLVGQPFPNVNINIMEDGEIHLKSDQLFSGYWQMQKTNSMHPTGDLGHLDDQGRIVLLGRKKDMMIRGNFNIYPALYEPTISKIKGIKEAVMIGIYKPAITDEEIILVIDGEDGLSSENIMKLLVQGEFSIDKEALPDKIVFMQIPRSGRQQKVDRKHLVQILSAS